MRYEIGQVLTAKRDLEVVLDISGETVKIPKGTKAIVRSDRNVFHPKIRLIRPLAANAELSGYDNQGIAEYLADYYCSATLLDEILNKDEMVDILKEALDNILIEKK